MTFLSTGMAATVGRSVQECQGLRLDLRGHGRRQRITYLRFRLFLSDSSVQKCEALMVPFRRRHGLRLMAGVITVM